MLRHYWKAALRSLGKKKLFTGINFIGLSLSLAIFLALISYVQYQFSYDKFYDAGDRIYRIDYYEYFQGQPILQSARTHDRTTLLVHEYVPQVEVVARAYHEKAYVFTENIRIVDQDMLFADSSFMKVFPIKLVSGSDQSLTPPKAVMISKSQAEVYFGQEDPTGKTLYFNERLPFVVTGVFEDIPENSSLDFDFLVSWSTLSFYGWVPREGSFQYPWTFTFVKLKEHADPVSVNQGLTALANEHNIDLAKRNHTAKQELRAYADLHLSSGLSGELKPGINKNLLYALTSIAVFILVAAWINYVNLSLARSLERADEIGVRKVFGASRAIISGQFLLEAFILSVITFAGGLTLYKLASGPLASAIFNDIEFSSPSVFTWAIYLVAFVLGTTLVAFYPAHFIARFKPVLILKNKLGNSSGNAHLLYQTLIVFQLFLAISVVGITFIAGRQMAFLSEFDSGFNAQQTITLRAPASTNSDSLRYSRYVTFRNEVLQNSAFKSGTSSMNIPGEEIRFHDENVHAVGAANLKKQSFWVMWIDEGFQDTFGLTLLAGRNFNLTEPGQPCLVNETAARALGYDNPTDAVNTNIITSDNRQVTILGIWKDYRQQSLRKPVEPIIFYHRHPHEYGYYSFSVQTRQADFLDDLKNTWTKHYPNDTFTFYFMDRFFAEQYRADQLFARLLGVFSFIAISVACLGLFGMATLSMVKRTKEIGVRKVLGATVWNILVLLCKSYLKLIVISCVFAFPLAHYLASQWLNEFVDKIEVEWWMIVLPGLLVLAATLLTISTQSIKASLTNPVKILRDQ